MQRRQKLRLGALLILILASPASFAYAKVYIDISAPAAKRLPIAIQGLYPMQSEAAAASSKATDVITRDLEVSGIFNILDSRSYPEEPLKTELSPERIDFRPWVAIGAETLLKGKVSMAGQHLSVEARLYDAITGKQIMASSYKGDETEIRRIAHRIADDIMSSVTGERGIFSTGIAFVSNVTGNKEIYVMDYDGEGVEALTRNGSINISPSWSPDGSAISYLSFKGGRPEVYIRDVGSRKEARLPITEGTSMGGSWSPDGKRLALVISRNGNAEIYVISRDGSGLTRLTNNWGLDVSPSWSPNGAEIAFVSDRGGTPQIYIMDSSGGNVRRLTFEGNYNASPAWSPKGDRITFAGMSNGRFEIFIMNPDGSGLMQLTADTGNNETPTWSPDGRFISFSSTRDGGSNIYIMRSDGSGQRRVTSMKGNATNPSWRPRVKE